MDSEDEDSKDLAQIAAERIAAFANWLLRPNGVPVSREKIDNFVHLFCEYSDLYYTAGKQSAQTLTALEKLRTECPEWADKAVADFEQVANTQDLREPWYRDGLGH